jgi:hypothetical protein
MREIGCDRCHPGRDPPPTSGEETGVSPAFVRRWLGWIVAVFVLLAAGIALAVWGSRPRLTDERVREAVYAAIQRETGASFYVTGTLDIVTTIRVENTRYLLPELIGMRLGTARSIVRVPGRASYGFDAATLRPEMVRIAEDGVIEIQIPPLSVFAVEPNLAAMEIDTETGWTRLPAAGRRVERRALGEVNDGLRQQAAAHVRDSTQPRLNTARALEELLRPVLHGLGLQEPRFRFRLGGEVVVEPRDR